MPPEEFKKRGRKPSFFVFELAQYFTFE